VAGARAPAQPRGHGGPVAVPGRWRALSPEPLEDLRELLAADLAELDLDTDLVEHPVQDMFSLP